MDSRRDRVYNPQYDQPVVSSSLSRQDTLSYLAPVKPQARAATGSNLSQTGSALLKALLEAPHFCLATEVN